MDFTWAKEDQNIRKQQSLLQKSQPIPSPLSSVRLVFI
jgi:hypothetical protein